MKTLKYFFIYCLLFGLVSCGVYKRNTTATNLKTKLVDTEIQQKNKVVLETLESTLAYYGIDTLDPLLKAKPKWTLKTKKNTKTVDKGTLDKKKESTTNLQEESTEKQNPWRPPWYLSGLIILVLLVLHKIFKTKYTIVKRI